MKRIALAGLLLTLLSAFLLTPADPAVAEDAKGKVLNLIKPAGNGPFPAAVILHGCGGIHPNASDWQEFLKAHGFASVLVESFWQNMCNNMMAISMAGRVEDAYKGLRYLVELPFVDKNRVVVMGFSNGAVTVLSAMDRRLQRRLVAGHPKFRAGIALYPECSFFVGSRFAPLLILIGRDDNWTLASSCEKLLRKAEEERLDPLPKLIIYEGAHHGFDDPKAGGNLPNASNLNSPMGYGASAYYNGQVTERARADVLSFLKSVL